MLVTDAGVAQLAAQTTCNRQVVGSSPTTGSKGQKCPPDLGTPAPARVRPPGRATREVTNGLDVVAVGIAHERAVVAGVVLGPKPGLVEHLGPLRHGSIKEGPHGRPVGGVEGDVGLAEALARHRRADPELGPLPDAEADNLPEVHHPAAAQWCKDGVVEGDAPGDVGTLD